MQKQFSHLLILLLVVLLTWFVIPLIAVDGVQLLATTTEKLLTICLISFGWISFLLFNKSNHLESETHWFVNWRKWQKKLAKKLSSQKTLQLQHKVVNINSNNIYQKLHYITQKHFQKVSDYLHAKHKRKKYPLYVLLGHSQSGKTTLLKQSGLDLKTFPSNDIAHVGDSDQKLILWHTDGQFIFVDTPGDYASCEIDEKTVTPWQNLIELFVRKYRHHPIMSVLLVVDICDMLTSSAQNFKLKMHLLKHRLQDLKKNYAEKLPVKLVFSKWDAVNGFAEFFDHLTETERQSVFSMPLKSQNSEKTISDQFQQQFQIILQKMNSMLINRMHHEHNQQKKSALCQFPLQLEQMQKQLLYVVQQLLETPNELDLIQPEAIYFTSNLQNETHIDLIQKDLHEKFHFPIDQSHFKQAAYSKSFFVKDFFYNLVNSAPQTSIELVINKKQQYLMYGACASLLIVFTAFCLTKFTDGIKMLNQAEKTTYAVNILENKMPNPKAKQAVLSDLIKQYNHYSNFWVGNRFGQTTLATNEKTVAGNRQISLATSFNASNASTHYSQLKDYLENQLQNKQLSPLARFDTLKAYLMLGSGKQHLNKAWLSHWLKRNALKQQVITSTQFQTIFQELANSDIIVDNKQLIAKTRQQLRDFPRQYLAFLILQSRAESAMHKDLTLNLINQKITVPFLFTATGMQTLFLNEVSNAAKAAYTGNWVLGPLNEQQTVAKIKDQIIELYVTNYVNWWLHVMNRFSVPTFKNLSTLANYTKNLLDPNSGLVANLAVIQNNLNPTKIFPGAINEATIKILKSRITTQLSAKAPDLLALNLNTLHSALSDYDSQLSKFAGANSKKQAFDFLKMVFSHPKQKNPLLANNFTMPHLAGALKHDLYFLTQQVKPLIESAATQYIENLWQKKILAFYTTNLQNRYPLYSNSTQAISLSDFSKFFAPQGLLQSFFKNNLKVFINSTASNWTLNTVAGFKLPLSQQLINSIEQGRIITAMFFPNESDSIHVEFNLQQIALMPIVKSFQLSINGQTLNDQQGSKNISTFIWPGNSDSDLTKLTFLDVNGQHATSTQQGPWAWFRLIHNSYIHSDGNSQTYVLTFDIDGTEARYKLTTSDAINPFISDIINSFRLPKAIVS